MPDIALLRRLHKLFRRNTSYCAAAKRSAPPRLEALEDRITPTTHAPSVYTASAGGGNTPGSNIDIHAFAAQPFTTTSSGTAATQPSQSQALISLFIDGATLEAYNLSFKYIHGDNFNIDNYFGTPSQLAVVRANAAADGINYDSVNTLVRFLSNYRIPYLVQADIGANLPYAGPFATIAVFVGAKAALDAVQLS